MRGFTAEGFESSLKPVNEVKRVWFTDFSTRPLPCLFLSLLHRICSESLKQQAMPSWHTSATSDLFMKDKSVPENATEEDSKGQPRIGLKVMFFLCCAASLFRWSSEVSRRATWPVSSPRLCRRSRSQSRQRRCWWIRRACRRSSGTATRPSCLRGCRSCGTS